MGAPMRNSDRYVRGAWRLEILDGEHWIPLEQPQRLNALLKEHLLG
jgi:pimeloyl-ACP methyl ester carboxylesterase